MNKTKYLINYYAVINKQMNLSILLELIQMFCILYEEIIEGKQIKFVFYNQY